MAWMLLYKERGLFTAAAHAVLSRPGPEKGTVPFARLNPATTPAVQLDTPASRGVSLRTPRVTRGVRRLTPRLEGSKVTLIYFPQGDGPINLGASHARETS